MSGAALGHSSVESPDDSLPGRGRAGRADDGAVASVPGPGRPAQSSSPPSPPSSPPVGVVAPTSLHEAEAPLWPMRTTCTVVASTDEHREHDDGGEQGGARCGAGVPSDAVAARGRGPARARRSRNHRAQASTATTKHEVDQAVAELGVLLERAGSPRPGRSSDSPLSVASGTMTRATVARIGREDAGPVPDPRRDRRQQQQQRGEGHEDHDRVDDERVQGDSADGVEHEVTSGRCRGEGAGAGPRNPAVVTPRRRPRVRETPLRES